MLIIAEAKLPNINPMINIDMVFLILLAIITTNNIIEKAPIAAAIIKDQFDKSMVENPPKETNKIKMAIPKLAPELIPKMYGSANGFLNKVCIKSPLTANADPAKMAVMAFGIRNSVIIICQFSLLIDLFKRILTISFKGIATEPKLIFIAKTIKNSDINNIKESLYVFTGFKILNIF